MDKSLTVKNRIQVLFRNFNSAPWSLEATTSPHTVPHQSSTFINSQPVGMKTKGLQND